MPNKTCIHLGNFQPVRLLTHPHLNLHVVIGRRRIVVVSESAGTLTVVGDIIDLDNEEILMCCSFVQSSLMVVGGQSRILKVFDLHTNKFLFPLKGHGGSINTVRSASHGKAVFTGSEDTSIRMWCLDRRRTICIFGGIAGHRDQVLSVDVSLCGTYIVSSSHDCTIKVWRVPLECKTCGAFYARAHDCGNVGDGILTVYFPIFSSSEIHRSFITCVRFYGEFIVAKGNTERLVAFKPRFNVEILNSYDNSDCFFIEEYVLECSKLNFKFFVDYKSRKLMIGSNNETGTFHVCNLDFMQEEMKVWKGNSGREKIVRDLTLHGDYLYILYEDNVLQRINV